MPLRPFVIDCDTGRDDALTLWLALALKLPLAAVIGSYGNTSRDRVLDNTARVLSLAGSDEIPLLAGVTKPPRLHRLFEPVVLGRQKASGNGLCNVELPKSKRPLPIDSSVPRTAKLLKNLSEKLGPLDYFVIGPASTIAALAQEWGNDLKKVVARIVMMGGKFDSLWQENPAPDFNIACDSFAVDQIMRLDMPPHFLPLNTTWPILLTLPEIERLQPSTPLAAASKELMIAHAKHFAPDHTFRFHDPTLLFAARQAPSFAKKKLRIELDESSPDFGRLMEDPNGVACGVFEAENTTTDEFLYMILNGLGFNS